ncbi:outer membrane beta-barrel protein [Chitinophaga sp. GCM10012297]|uniref:Outer membrane beta-barrel protein n=1 Tax=Chitinophaga chungangae TaxID=2821488 RepID=A0ABS3YF86_9BACT|nr:outer membrane beta-barrel protein [Chitinophaga chungangae]MBO9152769.1 outer membrane beta-barrel protein [Chitinophaga chungangae]
MKISTLLFVMLLCVIVPAFSQVSLGIRSGYTASNMHISGEAPGGFGSTGGSETLHGWHLELLLNVPVVAGFYLQPGFRYVTKGAALDETFDIKTELSGVYIPRGSALRLNYFEMPLNIVYKRPLWKGRATLGVGPYLARGLNGRYSYNIVQNGNTVTKHIKDVQFSRRHNDNLAVLRMYPWDAGANFAIGYEFDNYLMLGANYSLGLTDNDRSGFTESRNRYVGISVGVLFNREDY